MTDHDDIAGLVEVFFAAFTSGPDIGARMDALRAVMLEVKQATLRVLDTTSLRDTLRLPEPLAV